MRDEHPRNERAIPAALGAIALWASLAAIARSLSAWPPFLLTGCSLLLGALVTVHRWRDWRVPLRTLALGVIGMSGYHTALFLSFRLAPAVEANLLNYLWPTFLVLFAPIFVPGARLRVAHVLGTSLGLVGAALLVTRGQLSIDSSKLPGYLLAVVAAVVWASYSLLCRRVPPFANAAVGLFCAVAGAISLAIHALLEPRYTPQIGDIPWLLVLGFGPMGAAFVLWNHAMTRGDPRTIGALSYLTPLLSTLLLLVTGGGSLSTLIVLAGGLILGGAAIGSVAGRDSSSHVLDAPLDLAMDANEFRRLGHQLIDWIADYREGISRLPVMSRVAPGEIRKGFDVAPPQKGGQIASAMASLDEKVMRGITHWNHPSFFAYFPSNTSFASILGDLASSGIGAQGMSWQTSPAATEVEEVVMDWLRQMVGLSTSFSGVIHDTASTATLTALLCAREKASDYSQGRGGLQRTDAPLVVYASDQGHSSIEKAALLAGFGRDFLRLIPTDDDHAIRVDLLRAAIEHDLKSGLRPCAIVAAVGTTGTTAIDSVAALADVAEQHGVWLHVDAALAGTAMVLPECRWMWEGVERADSVVFNPHKWMGVGFDLSAYYVRDPQHLIRVMSTNPSYLRTPHDGSVSNFRDWHIQLGRRFRALKLWFYLMDVGVEGLQARLRRDLENANWLKAQVDATSDWERLAPVPLQTVCIRHVVHGLDEAGVSAHNLEIARRVNESGVAYLTPSMLKGKQILRVSVGAETTEIEHVRALWQALRRAAEGLPVVRICGRNSSIIMLAEARLRA